ncbi:MAG: rhodanese-related sulfurtransferase [Bacteroidetes bacterium]|nr:rhodanese-related sulfurtransferase [Bacteroidota bacterium]
MILHNRVNRKELRLRLRQEHFRRITMSFYRFVEVDDPQAFRDELYLRFSQLQVLGRIYVAHEGINAQLSVPEHRLEEFESYVRQHPYIGNVLLNRAIDDNGMSFFMLKVMVKHKILSDGLDNSTFNIYDVGEHLDAVAYNRKLNEPGTMLIDLRNCYEHEVGHFEGAVLPVVSTYKESVPVIVAMIEQQQPQNIMLYCTGGIRCEKFSAYLRHKGFKNVYQLKGGVINYARQVREQGLESRFIGKNFVFDERMGERITPHIIARCHQCGQPADTHVNCAWDPCHKLFIQCDACREKFEGCCSEDCAKNLKVLSQQTAG